MNNGNTYYQKNQKRLQERPRNRYHLQGGKEMRKNIMKITKKIERTITK